jgi:hypothetical protein
MALGLTLIKRWGLPAAAKGLAAMGAERAVGDFDHPAA